MSLQNTALILSELNNLLLGQYSMENRPNMKAEYYITQNGKLSDFSFREYWERLMKETSGFRVEILTFEKPEKIPLVKSLLDLLEDNVYLLSSEKNEYAQFIREISKELLRWLKTRMTKQVKPELVKEKTNKQTFQDLFKNPDNAKKIKEILESNHYTKNGKWAANKNLYLHHTGNKSELLAAFYALKNKGILKQGKDTPQAIIFYKEFGLKVGEYITDRSLRTEPPPHQQEIFEKLFYSIK